MNIAIITLPYNTNYGGILQSYALQTALERMGHHVSILDTTDHVRPRLPLLKSPLSISKRLVFKYILKKYRSPILYEHALGMHLDEIERHTRRFINDYLNTVDIKDFHEIKPNSLDAIVVGSDQVWRPRYFPNNDRVSLLDAYLDFAKDWDIKRMSYAASYGTSQWEYSPAMTERCRQLIQRFDMVTVREADAVTMVKEKLGVDAKLVLDPTLLLDREDYTRLICRAEQVGVLSPAGGYGDFLMSYILDENQDLTAQILDLARSTATQVRQSKASSVSIWDFDPKDIKKYVQPPIENWLRNFRDCKYVVTDSFHACVFSIIFHKPFVVLGNEKRGMSRFESLLTNLGLEDRLVYDMSNAKALLETEIEYDDVDIKLANLKSDSLNLLKSVCSN